MNITLNHIYTVLLWTCVLNIWIKLNKKMIQSNVIGSELQALPISFYIYLYFQVCSLEARLRRRPHTFPWATRRLPTAPARPTPCPPPCRAAPPGWTHRPDHRLHTCPQASRGKWGLVEKYRINDYATYYTTKKPEMHAHHHKCLLRNEFIPFVV